MDRLHSHAQQYVQEAQQISEAYLQMQTDVDKVILDEIIYMTNQELKHYLLRYDKDAPETECSIQYFQGELETQKEFMNIIKSMHKPKSYDDNSCQFNPDPDCQRRALDPANAWLEGRGYCKAKNVVVTQHTRAKYCRWVVFWENCYPAEMNYLWDTKSKVIPMEYRKYVENSANDLGEVYTSGACR